ncbi:MAG: ABC transporter permease [marine bacterium B5-7]|nr:MAG: ABC transporter permease [marine bacterium B5-7]
MRLVAEPFPQPDHKPEYAGGLRGVVQRSLEWLDRIIGGAATVALIALIIIIFSNVIGRYGFNRSITWAAEAAQWLFIGVIFLAIPLAHRARMHLSIGLIVDRLPAYLKRVAEMLSDVIIAYTTIMLMFGGLTIIQMVGGVNYALGMPTWIKFALIPFTCLLGLVYLSVRGIDEGRAPWRGPLAIAIALIIYSVVNKAGMISISGSDPGLTMILAFAAAMALGTPVSFAMLFSAFMANLAGGLLPPAAVVQNMVNGSTKFLLLAIPFFITAGALMNAGGLTTRLMDFAFKLVGHFRGGFAQVNIVSSGLYAGISGSSYSEAALGTKLLVPQMVRHGYSAPFSCAVTAASATLPNVIPPSIALLILAAASNLSVGKLWIAGVLPGLVMIASLMLCVYVIARMKGYGTANERANSKQRWQALIKATPVLGLAIVIIGGIRFGVVTPTEAGVLAVVYSWILGMFVYREYGSKELWKTLSGAAVEAAMVGLLIGAAAPFAFVLVTEQIPQLITQYVTSISDNTLVVLLLVNILMLFFGMFLDIGAGILILTPLLMPVMITLGIDPIHFGIVIVVNLMLGGLTPPVGMLTFITGTISRTPVHEVFRAMTPLLAALIGALLLITYIPAISLGLGWLIDGT